MSELVGEHQVHRVRPPLPPGPTGPTERQGRDQVGHVEPGAVGLCVDLVDQAQIQSFVNGRIDELKFLPSVGINQDTLMQRVNLNNPPKPGGQILAGMSR